MENLHRGETAPSKIWLKSAADGFDFRKLGHLALFSCGSLNQQRSFTQRLAGFLSRLLLRQLLVVPCAAPHSQTSDGGHGVKGLIMLGPVEVAEYTGIAALSSAHSSCNVVFQSM